MWLVRSQHFHKQLQPDQGLAADLVEGVTDGGDDGRDQGGRVGVDHGGVMASQEALNEGQGVNLHVAVFLDADKAELYARDQLHHVGGQGARQHQEHGKASCDI